MATVDGLTAAKMQEIADASVVSGTVNGSGHLILETSGGDTSDAGLVVGAAGATGPTGPQGAPGAGPVGTVIMFAGLIAPFGYILCDGRAISRLTYPVLFRTLGTTYGAGDGVNTFNVPDMDGFFPHMDLTDVGGGGGTATHTHVLDQHAHNIDGGATDAVAHVLIQTGSAPNIFMERIATGAGAFTSNFQGDATSTATSTLAASAGAKVSGQTNGSTPALTLTHADSSLPPYVNLYFYIQGDT
jgi:microcystin-dependent protein